MVPSAVLLLVLLFALGGVAFWLYRRLVTGRLRKAKKEEEAGSSSHLAAFRHDIRSPLNAIYGYAQLLERGANIAPLEAARVIRRSCEHLTALVDGLQGDAPKPQGHPRFARYDGAVCSVLLIDDDADQLALLRAFLEPLGFVVHAACDGAQGLAMAQRHRPDLVLLDVTMPGLSGWEVAAGLRAMMGGDLRIIMVSGDADDASFDAHDCFLLKPVDLDALLDAVGAVLARPAAGRLPTKAAPFLAEIEAELRIGHVRGIAQGIRALGNAVPEAAGAVPHLLELLDRCDMAGLGAAVIDLRKVLPK